MSAQNKILEGDCLDVMRSMDADSVDAVVTDPPYGIRFMGKAWDGQAIQEAADRDTQQRKSLGPYSEHTDGYKRKRPRTSSAFGNSAGQAGSYDFTLTGNQAFQQWTEAWAREALRVLKPGGHLLAFGGTRTHHRMVCAIEDAGFEIRDAIQWIYGQGFPKSKNIGDGWGTALKPAHEPIVLARKPLSESSIARNVLEHGTGALNIDGTRVGSGGNHGGGAKMSSSGKTLNSFGQYESDGFKSSTQGRWPSNLVLSHSPECNGACVGGCPVGGLGEPARFFYVAKASRAERNKGLDGMLGERVKVSTPPGPGRRRNKEGVTEDGKWVTPPRQNHHPTVKPINLMKYLCRMICPPGGTILDPFCGSGSTGCAAVQEGFNFIGVEQDASYCEIARKRIAYWSRSECKNGQPSGNGVRAHQASDQSEPALF